MITQGHLEQSAYEDSLSGSGGTSQSAVWMRKEHWPMGCAPKFKEKELQTQSFNSYHSSPYFSIGRVHNLVHSLPNIETRFGLNYRRNAHHPEIDTEIKRPWMSSFWEGVRGKRVFIHTRRSYIKLGRRTLFCFILLGSLTMGKKV